MNMAQKNGKTVIPINGMHCASCTMTVEDALKQTEGVIEANVNIATEKAVIQYARARECMMVDENARAMCTPYPSMPSIIIHKSDKIHKNLRS
jgi:Cu+-exporting ATPase